MTQIAVETLDFAFSLGAIRTAKLDDETTVARLIEKSTVETMRTFTPGIALNHHGLYVVVQHAVRHAVKVLERTQITSSQLARQAA